MFFTFRRIDEGYKTAVEFIIRGILHINYNDSLKYSRPVTRCSRFNIIHFNMYAFPKNKIWSKVHKMKKINDYRRTMTNRLHSVNAEQPAPNRGTRKISNHTRKIPSIPTL